MAPGLPYTIAAQVAFPDRQCIAFVGDGGFTMLMGDFATAVKYDLPIKVVIVKNNSLGQIKWEQMVFLGNPEYGCELNPIDFAKFAEACGAKGYTIDDPATCGAILDEALAHPGPVIIEAVVDPNEPPMPARIEPQQALAFRGIAGQRHAQSYQNCAHRDVGSRARIDLMNTSALQVLAAQKPTEKERK